MRVHQLALLCRRRRYQRHCRNTAALLHEPPHSWTSRHTAVRAATLRRRTTWHTTVRAARGSRAIVAPLIESPPCCTKLHEPPHSWTSRHTVVRAAAPRCRTTWHTTVQAARGSSQLGPAAAAQVQLPAKPAYTILDSLSQPSVCCTSSQHPCQQSMRHYMFELSHHLLN